MSQRLVTDFLCFRILLGFLNICPLLPNRCDSHIISSDTGSQSHRLGSKMADFCLFLLFFMITTKKCSKYLRNTKKCSNFAVSNKRDKNMKEKRIIMAVSEKEEELLAAIRNYNKSFPDGYPQLLFYAQMLFDNMLRQPYE